MKTSTFLATALFMAFAVGNALLLMQELGPFFARDASRTGPLNRFSGQENLDYGYSSYSKRLVLDDCFMGMQTLVLDGAPGDTIVAFDRKCEKIASEIIASIPSNSYAWHVKALAHAALGEEEKFNASMRLSQLTGPNEQWIADLRVKFSEKNFALLDEATQKTHEKDLVLLAGSTRGTQTIASLYLKEPKFRERITTIVEKLPPSRQQDFISKIRALKEQG